MNKTEKKRNLKGKERMNTRNKEWKKIEKDREMNRINYVELKMKRIDRERSKTKKERDRKTKI